MCNGAICISGFFLCLGQFRIGQAKLHIEMPYLIQEKNATNFSHHLGVSKDGISMEITNATNAEMSNAQSETSQPDLKENLLNVKVSRGFFYLSNIFQMIFRCSTTL